MDHLFDDFAFYVRESAMAVVQMNGENEFDELRDKLRRMHVLDALEYLEGKEINIPTKQRDEFLREIV